MQEPLKSKLGRNGCTEEIAQFPAGNYVCPPEVEDYNRAFLESLTSMHPLANTSNDAGISKEYFMGYWRRAREQTSSSFSSLRFGHWKAAAFAAFLSEIHALTIELAYSSGYSITRWQVGMSVCWRRRQG